MTTAKLITSPAEGHGLTSKITDPLYHALTSGQPTESIVAVVVLKPVGCGQRETAKGRHQHVVFEATKLEPIHDRNQANELRYLAQRLYEARTSTGEQREIPLGLGGDEEKRQDVMERTEAWATSKGMTGAELERVWREHHGIGPDSEWSYGDAGVPGDYRKATLAHLLAFGYEVGALSTDEPLPSDEREDDDPDATDDTEPAGDEKCQVCGKTDVPLTDGLCEADAKNVGLRAVPDQAEKPKRGKAAGGKA